MTKIWKKYDKNDKRQNADLVKIENFNNSKNNNNKWQNVWIVDLGKLKIQLFQIAQQK